MMNEGCFSFEVISCPEVQSGHAAIRVARIFVITASTALIILTILLIVCAEARLNADTTENGEAPERDFCERIRYARSVVRTGNSLRQPW